jgi:hypothetical protein
VCNNGFSGVNCSVYNCSIDDPVSCENSSIDCSSSLTFNLCPQTCSFDCQQSTTSRRSRAPSQLPDTQPTTTDLLTTSYYCNYTQCGSNEIFNVSTCSCNYNCSAENRYECFSNILDCSDLVNFLTCTGTCNGNCSQLGNYTTLKSTNDVSNKTTSFIPTSSGLTTLSSQTSTNLSSTLLTTLQTVLTSATILTTSTTILTTTPFRSTTTCNTFVTCSLTQNFDPIACECVCADNFSGPTCQNFNCSITDPPFCTATDCTVPSNVLVCPNKCSC